jgi:hypothetical protein
MVTVRRYLVLTLGDDLFTSTAVDVYFDAVYTYGTLDMIRTLHELIPVDIILKHQLVILTMTSLNFTVHRNQKPTSEV